MNFSHQYSSFSPLYTSLVCSELLWLDGPVIPMSFFLETFSWALFGMTFHLNTFVSWVDKIKRTIYVECFLDLETTIKIKCMILFYPFRSSHYCQSNATLPSKVSSNYYSLKKIYIFSTVSIPFKYSSHEEASDMSILTRPWKFLFASFTQNLWLWDLFSARKICGLCLFSVECLLSRSHPVKAL